MSFLLLQDKHLAQERKVIGFELVEIDTARNAFTDSVPTIPIGSAASTRVVAFSLITEIELADDAAAGIIDGNLHITRIC